MLPSIVVASNPFGYGPTGKAIAIIIELRKRLPDTRIIFIGSMLCREIIHTNDIEIIDLDERNATKLEDFIKSVPDPVIISSQNRFIIKVAKKLNVPCAFLDGLAWFWKNIPDEHTKADIIFWPKYPGIEKKLLPNANIHLVPAIISPLKCKRRTNNPASILIHIGGCENPLTDRLPLGYLALLANVLNKIETDGRIIVVGGVKAIKFINKLVDTKKIKAKSFKQDQFLETLAGSDHLVTTAGQTATIESFTLGVPVSFLLPTNLSQMALADYLNNYRASENTMTWEKYIKVDPRIRQLTEKEALVLIDQYANCILEDKQVLENFQKDFFDLIYKIPDNSYQKKFVSMIGVDGAQKIVDILLEAWKLI